MTLITLSELIQAIAQRLADAHVAFGQGTTNADEPFYAAFNGRTFRRYVAGFEGKADLYKVMRELSA
mgnify:CR=1 FL=1